MIHDALGDRMKRYERASKSYLTARTPVIIRIDGKAFHTFTRGFEKPFDNVLVRAMQDTMLYLCRNIQGCVLGYTQSDEISLVLVDYKNLDTSAWFDNNIQKCVSVAASMATYAFMMAFSSGIKAYELSNENPDPEYISVLINAFNRGAMFDARAFNLPREEVTNCILWRQNDAVRNSIEMVGHCHFSAKQLMNKSCSDIKNMLKEQCGIIWEDYPVHLQRGSCCVRDKETNEWLVDKSIPIFKDIGRSYIDDLVFIGD